MKRGRVFAYIYEINSLEVKAYLLPGTDSLIQSHYKGISKVARIGSYVIINSGGTKLVGVVSSLHVTEPEKLYWIKTKPDFADKQLIRNITITLIGQFYYDNKNVLVFERGINSYPSIDEEVMAPTQEEMDLILNERIEDSSKLLEIGVSYPTNDTRIKVSPVKLFSRHCGIFGSTGNGKSCTVTVLINEIIRKMIKMPVFVFDINGEYSWAFKNMPDIIVTKFVGKMEEEYPRENKHVIEEVRFNYSSFSRTTIRSILKPSEKTQIPALNYAYDTLPYLGLCLDELKVEEWLSTYIPKTLKDNPSKEMFRCLVGDPSETDSEKLKCAFETLEFLAILTARGVERKCSKSVAMSSLSKVVCDRWSIVAAKNRVYEYNAFRYQNVASMCDRITELCRDNLFRLFCDTFGKSGMDLAQTFTNEYTDSGVKKESKIIIFDLSKVPQEYIMIVIDSMLEAHLEEALKGKFIKRPHLLVLDEAHHYMGNRIYPDSSTIYLSNPPGERVAKEGRKYGLHLLISSQRPREMSNTITSQIGTIISHALTHESDREIISGFGTYNDRTILNSLSILPRREAIIIGQAISMPTRFKVTFLPEEMRPKSKDPLEDIMISE